ncbi:MAG TPA: zinc-binding alcohol dehydrogenase family protein [Acidimicrobiales bacterium]|nr:zinc-binding alcohol dehydrogenase family protein [Acidimicrobiales bacterium]
MRTMAARLQAHGEPLTVEEIEIGPPASGQVRVDMAFGGVNPIDRYHALGRVATDAPLPRTLGLEGSAWLDDRPVLVRAYATGSLIAGLWAGTALVADSSIVPIPDGVDLDVAAAMGIAGVTAWRCAVEKAQIASDDRVLVLGASGGVGSILVSLARSAGATVWGQTGSESKAGWIRARGASEVVVGDAAAVADAAGEYRPTVVFDPLGGDYFGAAVGIMANRGRLVPFGTSAGPEGQVPLQQLYRKGITVLGYAGLIESEEVLTQAATEALAALAAGRFEIVIDRAVPLGQVNTALDLLSDRSVLGNVVLDLRSA